MISKYIIRKIKPFFPDLKTQLVIAGMSQTAEKFMKENLVKAINMWAMLMFILVLLGLKNPKMFFLFIPLAPLLYVGVFYYIMQLPTIKILKREKDINKEIVYAGRFLIIELESGVPLYNAFINVSKSYKKIGPYFSEIVNKINFGTAMEDAINEAIIFSPSGNLRKILWQIFNSLHTGSDVHHSLASIVEQIVREQIIDMKKYSKKLNPLAMFYMMIAIIVPTLGTAMLAVLASFISIEINMPILLVMVFFLGFIQMMFLNIIKSQRPAVDL